MQQQSGLEIAFCEYLRNHRTSDKYRSRWAQPVIKIVEPAVVDVKVEELSRNVRHYAGCGIKFQFSVY